MKITKIAHSIKTVITSCVILLSLIACGGSLTRASFDKVSNGMPVEEVKKLLGEPTSVETLSVPVLGTVTRYGYKTDKGEASVIFRDNQVQSKAGSIGQ
jgi:uncharacterized protein YycO